MGCVLNSIYFGSAASGGTAYGLEADLPLNVLSRACFTAFVAYLMSVIRFGIKYWLHPRLYGVFSFIVYLVLVFILLIDVYEGDLIVVTTAPATEFASQLFNTLNSPFDNQDNTFSSVRRVRAQLVSNALLAWSG